MCHHRCCRRHVARRRRFTVTIPASLSPLSPSFFHRHQANPVPTPFLSLLPPSFPSLTFCHRLSTLIPYTPLLPSKARASTVAVTVALPVAAVSLSLFQPRYNYCCHRIIISTKQTPRRCFSFAVSAAFPVAAISLSPFQFIASLLPLSSKARAS